MSQLSLANSNLLGVLYSTFSHDPCHTGLPEAHELSEAKVFERQYSSITDAIADGLPKAPFDRIEHAVFEATKVLGTGHIFFIGLWTEPHEQALIKFGLKSTPE